jgi:hypothetical protein
MSKTNKEPAVPLLRIYVGAQGVLKIDGQVSGPRERSSALEFCGRLMPAIRRLDKAVRRDFVQ